VELLDLKVYVSVGWACVRVCNGSRALYLDPNMFLSRL